MSRNERYRDFYRGPQDDGRPLGVVHGNCQAEALRVLLAGSPTFGWQVMRVPPVHELERADLAPLDRLLARCTLLLAQPVRPDYRGLSLGTAQVAGRLGEIRAPLEPPALATLGLNPAQARDHWLIKGEEVAAEDVAAAHRAWYVTRPDAVAAGLARHAERLPVLGLA